MSATETRPLNRPPTRCGVRAYRPRRRRAAPTRLGWALGLVLLLLVAGVGVAAVRAEDGDEIPRYTPSARGTRPAVTRWRPLLEQYDWDVATALRVVDCESGGDASVPNQQGSGALGLFQAMPNWRGLAYRLTGSTDLANPWVNVAVAYALWADAGGTFGYWGADGRAYGHWAASIRCWSW